MDDTTVDAQKQYDEMLKALTPVERFRRTVELSAYVRALAWTGAEDFAGHLGRAAVLQRFFLQVYGPSVPVPRALLAASEVYDLP